MGEAALINREHIDCRPNAAAAVDFAGVDVAATVAVLIAIHSAAQALLNTPYWYLEELMNSWLKGGGGTASVVLGRPTSCPLLHAGTQGIEPQQLEMGESSQCHRE